MSVVAEKISGVNTGLDAGVIRLSVLLYLNPVQTSGQVVRTSGVGPWADHDHPGSGLIHGMLVNPMAMSVAGGLG